jgi:DNA-binding XRE family transcriptional regulator
MPNIAMVLRQEISRLSRKESRSQIDLTKKATAQHRRDIAALKRQVAQLERQVTLLSRRALATPPATPSDSTPKSMRFGAKALRSQRNRLGLSAIELGRLLGVSAQSIYNWERELARPRPEQLSKLVALRGIGKREVGERLQRLVSGKETRR